MGLFSCFEALLGGQVRQIKNRYHKESHTPKVQFHIQKRPQECAHHKAKHNAEAFHHRLLVRRGTIAQIIGQINAQLGGVTGHHGAGADVFDQGFAGGIAYRQCD